MPGIIQNMEEKVDRSQGAIDKELVGEEKPGKERVNARERQRERGRRSERGLHLRNQVNKPKTKPKLRRVIGI